jgi:outer membrane protein assembly factor BamB
VSHDGPWSPFPVQDWSSLPADPLRPAGPSPTDPAAVDPSWAPPRGHRWWPPLIVLLLVGALIGGAAYAGSSLGLTPPATAATRFLPVDGSAGYERVETTRELQTSTGTQVTESALFSGFTGLLSIDGAFGNKLLAGDPGDPATLRSWRTVSTPVDEPASSAQSAQTTRLYRTNTGIELLGESGPTAAYIYAPALVELPADAHPGSSWTGSGSAGDHLGYTSRFEAAAAPGGCLQVSGEVRYLTDNNPPGRSVSQEQTWCPGRGVVASFTSMGAITVRVGRVDTPGPDPTTTGPSTTGPTTTAPIDTAPASISWASPESWTNHLLSTTSTDPTLGEAPMSGSPQALTPVRTASGLVVRALSSLHDLVATAPKMAGQWTSTWRVHVPGTVLTLRAFGNVVIATTSERAMVAYSDAGVRLWQLSLTEIAATPPVRASDTTAVLVDLSGEVRSFTIATGEIGWRHSIGSDVNVPLAVGSGTVVTMDRGGTTTGLDLATGASRWTTDLLGAAAGFAGGTLVVLQDQTAHGIDPATGKTRWLRPFTGTFTDLEPLGDQLMLSTKNASVLLDPSGQVTARLDAFLVVTAAQNYLLGWGTDEAEVIDATGKVTARWKLPTLTLAMQDRPAVALPDGVLLFGGEWSVQEWSR